jgi:hypothetical protein
VWYMNRINQIVVYDHLTHNRYTFTAETQKEALQQFINMINEKYLNENRLVLKWGSETKKLAVIHGRNYPTSKNYYFIRVYIMA